MKGQKTGGRKKGSTNKRSGSFREKIMNFCEEHFDEYVEAYNLIDEPKEKCKAYRELLAFGMAKPAQVDVNVSAEKKSFMDDIRALTEDKE